MLRPEEKKEVLVEADGPYLAVFDLESPANRAGIYQESWDAAWDFERNSPGAFKGAWDSQEMDIAGERFDQYWKERQSKGELVFWVFATGTARVALRLEKGKERGEAFLDCPSGRLLAAPLKALGEAAAAAFEVPPGRYSVRIEEGPEDSYTVSLGPRLRIPKPARPR